MLRNISPTLYGASGLTIMQILPPAPMDIESWARMAIVAITAIVQVITFFKRPKIVVVPADPSTIVPQAVKLP